MRIHSSAAWSLACLVRVYDLGDAPRPYLVLEYVDGGTLADQRDHEGCGVDLDALARDLLSALAHVHGAGIVHRDVKPANVLVDRQHRPRLTDFGIAQPADATRMTLTGALLGTLRYLAPEVLRGDPATPRSDLCSLGVMLAECAQTSPPPRLAELSAWLREDQPDRRPASAAAALAWLKEQDSTSTARPPSAATETATQPLLRERFDGALRELAGWRPRLGEAQARRLPDGRREIEWRLTASGSRRSARSCCWPWSLIARVGRRRRRSRRAPRRGARRGSVEPAARRARAPGAGS